MFVCDRLANVVASLFTHEFRNRINSATCNSKRPTISDRTTSTPGFKCLARSCRAGKMAVVAALSSGKSLEKPRRVGNSKMVGENAKSWGRVAGCFVGKSWCENFAGNFIDGCRVTFFLWTIGSDIC